MSAWSKVASVLLPLAPLLVAVPADAAYVAPQGAVFNRPTAAGPGAENRIQDHLLDLIANTPRGAEIRVVMYSWRETPVADALIRAHDRGVRVRVLMSNSADSRSVPVYNRLRAELGAYRPSAASWTAQCRRGWGCLGTGINHNKFFLFSRVGDSRNVVVQSSANLTYDNRVKYWNNAYTVANGGVYALYNGYFSRLTAGITRTSTPSNNAYTAKASGAHKLYTFPRKGRGASTDTVVNALDNVACTSSTRIRVAVLELFRPDVARKLVSLKNRGCRVYLAFESLDNGVAGIIRGRLTGIHRCTGAKTVHSKYMTVESGTGSYAGKKGLDVVFTGSHNYNPNSLRRNDETMLRITGKAIHQQYEDNFDEGVYPSCPAW